MNVSREEVEAGQAVYTPRLLWFYDLIVIYFNMPFAWKCRAKNILKLYNSRISSNHLDIGVGSGYYLDKCKFPTGSPRVGLMDLNPNSLHFTAKRISRYKTELYRVNILEPIDLEIDKFDSIGINFVLHCLPGTMESKLSVFDNIKPLLNPGGVVFGSTILGTGVKQNLIARRLMRKFNYAGVFSNYEDDLQTLSRGFKDRFSECQITLTGMVAIFTGRI